MKHILIDMPRHERLAAQLESWPNVSLHWATPTERGPFWKPEVMTKANVLFSTEPPPEIRDATHLKFIQIGSVGYSHLSGLGLAERGIRVCNARGVFDPAIAEWTLAMMINLLRDTRAMIRHQEHGIWDRHPRFQRELRGLTVGIWGYGGIGRATARLAKACGLKVRVLVRSGVQPRQDTYLVSETGDAEGNLPDEIYSADQTSEFLSGLDFLVVAVPLTPATTGMIGEQQLRALPETAYLLNPARGPIIQEQALLRALREGWIAGATLDTHYYYPMPADHPLWRFPNVIMTPHISGSDSSPHYLERIWDIFGQNVQRLLNGEALLNELSLDNLRELS